MGTVCRLIKKTPSPIRRWLWRNIPFDWRYDSRYREVLDIILKSQWIDPGALHRLRQEMLKQIVIHANSHVPYYRRVLGGIPNDVLARGFEMEHLDLPILTRQDVRDNWHDLIADNIDPRRMVRFSTSGSTGAPLTIMGTKDMFAIEAAFLQRAYMAQGARLYNEKSIWLRRYSPGPGDPLWYEDEELSRLYVSPFHLSLRTIKDYVDEMNRYGARILSAYPSSLYILALLLEQADLTLHHVRVLHVASEKLLPQWRDKINSVFGLKVKAHYGMIERVSMGFQCFQSDLYHENVDYGYTEFVYDPVMDAHKIIGTSFMNYAMPLIRYDTGDYAVFKHAGEQCDCGRSLPTFVSDYIGRSDDILVANDGVYIPPVNFYTMMYKVGNVEMFQIVQHDQSHIEVSIVASDGFDAENQFRLSTGLTNRFGAGMNIDLSFVPEIERDERTGKIRCIQNLSQSRV